MKEFLAEEIGGTINHLLKPRDVVVPYYYMVKRRKLTILIHCLTRDVVW
ncbi:hypothetical protein ASZ90_018157 [hydrocarbon metagenome]|uniref:Uncharacterized protein n=1 Tax=hydrocarbon metagenome TaxID=938273 RepID=A0A0W8E7L0_9ZZZZ